MNFTLKVSEPTVPVAKKVTEDQVWGTRVYDDNGVPEYRKDDGMILARSEQKCPIFGDVVPYKSVTVLCNIEQEKEVQYWLEYVQGAGCISRRRMVKVGKIALRVDYKCW